MCYIKIVRYKYMYVYSQFLEALVLTIHHEALLAVDCTAHKFHTYLFAQIYMLNSWNSKQITNCNSCFLSPYTTCVMLYNNHLCRVSALQPQIN